MADQLSGIAIIICIAFGVLTFILLFIFAKRQIVRFTLKSRGGLHAPVGGDAPKKLMLEIKRRLTAAAAIQCEPCVLTPENNESFSKISIYENFTPVHLYRMKVMEELKDFDQLIASRFPTRKRVPGEDVNLYYTNLFKEKVLPELDETVLHEFLSLYEHARYIPEAFAYEEYNKFNELLLKIKSCVIIEDLLSDEDTVNRRFSKHNVPKECTESTSLLKKNISFSASPTKHKQSCSSIETEV